MFSLSYVAGFVCGIIRDSILHRFGSNVAEASIVKCSCFGQNNRGKACSVGRIVWSTSET